MHVLANVAWKPDHVNLYIGCTVLVKTARLLCRQQFQTWASMLLQRPMTLRSLKRPGSWRFVISGPGEGSQSCKPESQALLSTSKPAGSSARGRKISPASTMPSVTAIQQVHPIKWLKTRILKVTFRKYMQRVSNLDTLCTLRRFWAVLKNFVSDPGLTCI